MRDETAHEWGTRRDVESRAAEGNPRNPRLLKSDSVSRALRRDETRNVPPQTERGE
jgi:hypothetical protein